MNFTHRNKKRGRTAGRNEDDIVTEENQMSCEGSQQGRPTLAHCHEGFCQGSWGLTPQETADPLLKTPRLALQRLNSTVISLHSIYLHQFL